MNIGKLGLSIKDMNNGKKSIGNPFPLYQTYTPTSTYKHKAKSARHTGGKWSLRNPQTARGESYAKPRTLLLIIHFWNM